MKNLQFDLLETIAQPPAAEMEKMVRQIKPQKQPRLGGAEKRGSLLRYVLIDYCIDLETTGE